MNCDFKIVFLVLIVWMSESWAQLLEKGCRMSQLDTKMKPPTKFTSDVIWPINDQEVNEMCNVFPRQINDAKNFLKKCAKGEAKTILSVSIHAMDKMTIKLYCKGKNENNEREKLMEMAKCANAGRKTSSKCWKKMISSMTAASNSTNTKDKIPLLCCSLNRWKECFIKTCEDIGAPVCPNDQIEYIDQYLYKGMVDPLNIFCSEYEDSDKCNKYDDVLTKSSTLKVKYGTPFPAIITLFESL